MTLRTDSRMLTYCRQNTKVKRTLKPFCKISLSYKKRITKTLADSLSINEPIPLLSLLPIFLSRGLRNINLVQKYQPLNLFPSLYFTNAFFKLFAIKQYEAVQS